MAAHVMQRLARALPFPMQFRTGARFAFAPSTSPREQLCAMFHTTIV
jgi:hypothetical protein